MREDKEQVYKTRRALVQWAQHMQLLTTESNVYRSILQAVKKESKLGQAPST
jgi:hypothetical protein